MADLGSTRVFGKLTVMHDILAHGNITANSDIRLKDDIQRIEGALDKVCALGGYTYQRRDIEVPRQTGVLAQEVLQVLPEAVKGGPTDEDPDALYSVAYGNLAGLLIEALKEERAMREKVEERLSRLENQKE